MDSIRMSDSRMEADSLTFDATKTASDARIQFLSGRKPGSSRLMMSR